MSPLFWVCDLICLRWSLQGQSFSCCLLSKSCYLPPGFCLERVATARGVSISERCKCFPHAGVVCLQDTWHMRVKGALRCQVGAQPNQTSDSRNRGCRICKRKIVLTSQNDHFLRLFCFGLAEAYPERPAAHGRVLGLESLETRFDGSGSD